MKKLRQTILALAIVAAAAPTFAQSETPQTGSIETHLQIKNMHLWRGYAVTEAAMSALDVAWVNPSKTFKVGVWGGAGWNGIYREFDYYFSYNKGGFNLALWDIYNFSTNLPSSKLFDYNSKTTQHFIDLTLGYNFGKSFPLTLSASTIIFGRDRDILPEDMLSPSPIRRGDNRYSTYIKASYPVVKTNGYSVDLYTAGAFALNGQTANFYGSKTNIVEAGFVVAKELTIGEYKIPVSATAMWNPELNIGNLQLAVNLF